MGCSFNYVMVPKKVQSVKDLREFYEQHKNKLLEEYGEDFEGYSGDMAVDDGELVVNKDLKLSVPSIKKEISQKMVEKDYSLFEKMMNLCEGHCEKWGSSMAIRVNDQWAICGAYSD